MKKDNGNDDVWDGLFDDEPGLLSKIFLNKKFWSFFILFIAGFSFGYIIWAGIFNSSNNIEEVPFLTADKSDYKYRAENDGVDIDYSESTIFETLDETDLSKTEEIVIDVKEEKIDRESLFSGFKTDIKKEEKEQKEVQLKQMEIKNDPDIEEIKEIKEIVKILKGNEKLDVKTLKITALPVPKLKKNIVSNKSTNSNEKINTVVRKGLWYVQLGSVKSAGVAKKEWDRLKKIYDTELNKVNFNIQKAEIANKGTFYRIRGGGMSLDKAKSICKSIKENRSGACIVVKGN